MVERRLATVMVADVAGYSRLMAEDDEATLAQLARHRALIEQSLALHRGRAFGEVADSVLAEFASPVEAVRCAVDLQLALHQVEAERPEARRMRWRIGLNLGDVMAHGRDLVGDGVNVAARLEALARPGGICLSALVIEHVRSHLALDFESLGRLQLKNIGRPVDAFRIPLPSDVETTAPYRGLLPFDADAAPMFHGRSRAVAETRERLAARAAAGRAFLLIWGASGVGKSSLVRAGLVPALIGAGTADGAGRWLVATMQMSAAVDPLRALADAVAHASPQRESASVEAAIRSAMARVGRAESGAARALHLALGEDRARLLVIVDQLEVLIADPSISSGSKALFVAALQTLTEGGHACLVATLRGDFFHRCAEIPGLAELREGLGSYELLPPSASEIGHMIREPVRRAGLEFEHTEQGGRLDDVLHEDAVGSGVPLPLLSFTMAALCAAAGWNRTLTFAEYRALGGFAGAIANRAEETVSRLPAAVAEALPAVLRNLVTVTADGTMTARSADRDQLAAVSEATELVERLVAARLLSSDRSETGAGVVRLAHEALLTHWPRAAELLRADRELLAIRARLEAEHARWHDERRQPDLLLAGRRLAEAEELVAHRGQDIGHELIDFVTVSARARDVAASRSLRRARALAATLALLAAGSAGLMLVAERARDEAERARAEMLVLQQEAVEARRIAEVERDKAETAASRLFARRAREAIDQGQPGLALGLALKAMPKALADPATGPDTAQARQALLEALDAQRRVAVLSPGGKAVNSAIFSPDGREVVTGTVDGRARIWRIDEDTVALATTQVASAITALAYSPDGARVAGGFEDGSLRLWDARTGAGLVSAEGHGGRVTSLSWDRTGSLLLSSSWDGSARVWSGSHLTSLLALQTSDDRIWSRTGGKTSDDRIWSAAFDPAGRQIATVAESGMLRFWSVEDGRLMREWRAHEKRIWSLAFSPDGRHIATGSHDRTARIWRADRGEVEYELAAHDDWVTSVAFSHDGQRLATGSGDQTVVIWDVATGVSLGRLKGHRHRVWSVRFSPDDSRLVSASEDGTAQLWDMSGWLPEIIIGDAAGARVAFAAESDLIVTGDAAGTVSVWDAATGTLVRTLVDRGPAIQTVASARQDRVMVVPAEGPVQLWRLSDGQLERTVDAGDGRLTAAALGSDGRMVALGGHDGGIRLFDLAGGASRTLITQHRGAVHGLAFSADGSLLLSAGADGTARLWDVAAGTVRNVLVDSDTPLLSTALAADGSRAVVAGDRTLVVVDLIRGNTTRSIDIGEEIVEAVTFDSASARFATAGRDGTVQLWDAVSGGGLAMFRGHGGAVLSVALSPDGSRILTGSSDGTSRLWTTPKATGFADVLDYARSSLPAGLTPDERDDSLLAH